MTILNIFNLTIILTITELLKNILVSNYYVNFIFFKLIKNNSNFKFFFNCLFCLFFFLTTVLIIVWLTLYYPIFLLLKIELYLYLFPTIILNSFFLILLKFYKKNYFFINIFTNTLYLVFLFISYKFNNFYIFFIFFYLISFSQILMAIFLLKNKINLKINLRDLQDLRNFYFLKKFIRFLLKSQLYKFFILIFLIIVCLKLNS
jgi:hypothetical protein